MSTATATKPAKTEAPAEIKISEAVSALAKVFESSIKVDKDGTVSIEGDIVADNLPTDLTMADIKRVQKHRGEVIAAATIALGKKALPALAKNKDLDKVHTGFKIAGDKVDLAIEREREFNDGKGGKLKKLGYVNLSYTATGATNAGEFKKARQQLANEATDLFG